MTGLSRKYTEPSSNFYTVATTRRFTQMFSLRIFTTLPRRIKKAPISFHRSSSRVKTLVTLMKMERSIHPDLAQARLWSLPFKSAESEDLGYYTCFFENEHGERTGVKYVVEVDHGTNFIEYFAEISRTIRAYTRDEHEIAFRVYIRLLREQKLCSSSRITFTGNGTLFHGSSGRWARP